MVALQIDDPIFMVDHSVTGTKYCPGAYLIMLVVRHLLAIMFYCKSTGKGIILILSWIATYTNEVGFHAPSPASTARFTLQLRSYRLK